MQDVAQCFMGLGLLAFALSVVFMWRLWFYVARLPFFDARKDNAYEMVLVERDSEGNETQRSVALRIRKRQ